MNLDEMAPRGGGKRPWLRANDARAYLGADAVGAPDPVEARLWFERAFAQGIDEAQADLDGLQ